MQANRPIRVLLGKVGLDGHDRGLLVIAQSLRDAGMEVIYTGIRRTPQQVVQAAIQEDVEAIGLSSMSGSHFPHFPRVAQRLRRCGRGDILLFGGGIIPPEDERRLLRSGFRKVFPPGSTLAEVVGFLRETLRPVPAIPLRKLDHVSIAVPDTEAALALFRDALGLTVIGQETVPQQKVKATFLKHGDVHLELVEPTSPDSPISNFLSRRGGGLHHLAFDTADVDRALEICAAHGLPLIDGASRPGSRRKKVAFLHPKGTHAVLLELTSKGAK